MGKLTTFRGYDIHEKDGKWFFSDSTEPVSHTWKHRSCGHCNMPNTLKGHDGCIGHLPGVMNACCGHGEPKSAYIQFIGGWTLRGFIAYGFCLILGRRVLRVGR